MSKLILKVKVIANAKQEEIKELGSLQFKVKMRVPPIEGRANKKLVQLLADYFKVNKSCVRIVKGLRTKEKIVEVIA